MKIAVGDVNFQILGAFLSKLRKVTVTARHFCVSVASHY